MASPQRPLILELVDAFNADLLAGEERVFATMLDSWLLVEQQLQDSIELLATQIADADNVLREDIIQLERFQILLAQTQDAIEEYADEIATPLLEARQSQMVTDAIDHSDLILRTAIGEANIDASFARLPVRAVQNLIGISGDGSPLRDTLTNTYGNAADGILNELLKGVSQGLNPRDTARNAVRNGLSQSLSHMMTVGRTESLRVYREVSAQNYRNSGVVDSYIRVETLDLTTCAGCLAEHGKEYPIDVPFAAHPNCRGTMIPKLNGVDYGLESGEEWFNTLSREDQQAMMGKGRMAYLDDGGEFSRLATERESNVWGNAVIPRAVKDL